MAPFNRIVVIGSINMDLVCRTSRIPLAGETILGSNLISIPGGKGANQAVAAARLAGPNMEIHLVGRVGDDDFGRHLLKDLDHAHVRTEYVKITAGVSSGCAMILVDGKGENSIVVAPGANAKLSPTDIDHAESLIASASVVVMQLEVPLKTIRHAISLCHRHGVYSILDPAPVPPRGLPRDLLLVDVLTPNQGEAAMLHRQAQKNRATSNPVPNATAIGMKLMSLGPRNVVLKLGPKGAMAFSDNGEFRRITAHAVPVVDTTAAGDAFTGALAIAHAEGLPLGDAAVFANAAGAACCTAFGAQPSLPTRKAVLKIQRQY